MAAGCMRGCWGGNCIGEGLKTAAPLKAAGGGPAPLLVMGAGEANMSNWLVGAGAVPSFIFKSMYKHTQLSKQLYR